jgi:hypothetical protein
MSKRFETTKDTKYTKGGTKGLPLFATGRVKWGVFGEGDEQAVRGVAGYLTGK